MYAAEINCREVYSEVYEYTLNVREQITQTIKAEALKAQDVKMQPQEVFVKAKEILALGFNDFETRLKNAYTKRPWTDYTAMIITSARKQYFGLGAPLCDTVMELLKPKQEQTATTLGESEIRQGGWIKC